MCADTRVASSCPFHYQWRERINYNYETQTYIAGNLRKIPIGSRGLVYIAKLYTRFMQK